MTKSLPTVLLLVCVLAFADQEKFNAGKYWLALPESAKNMYVSGFEDGISFGVHEVSKIYEPHRPRKKKNEFMSEPELKAMELSAEWGSKVVKNREQIIRTMSFLYADPTNSFITFDDMFVLSKMKLDGSNVEDGLAWARGKQERIDKLFRPTQ